MWWPQPTVSTSARRRAGVVLPDVVVMDMSLSDGSGAAATAEVLTVSPSSRVLVLSASDERDDVLEAVKAGATGYLVKSASKAELTAAVRATAAGRAVFTPGLAGLVLGEYRRIAQRPDDGPATPKPDRARDRGAALCGKGLTAKQIATRLSIEPPYGREPRPGHVPQVAGRQPCRIGPLCHRTRPRQSSPTHHGSRVCCHDGHMSEPHRVVIGQDVVRPTLRFRHM